MSVTEGQIQQEDGDLIVKSEGALGVIRLNRPRTINAFTHEMLRGINTALDVFETDPSIGMVLIEGNGERGFCAGGDIRGLYESIREGGDLGKVFWREEYIMNSRIAAYPKPYIAYMDGMVMGGGVGLAAHGRHRVLTERTQLADARGRHRVLSRCRRHLAARQCARRARYLFRPHRTTDERR